MVQTKNYCSIFVNASREKEGKSIVIWTFKIVDNRRDHVYHSSQINRQL